jgi:hypothetical protein
MTTSSYPDELTWQAPASSSRAFAQQPASLERRRVAAAFFEAALGLANGPGEEATRRPLAEAAGRALVRLAELGASRALLEVLTPDPAEQALTYTVACYQIGDVVPCELRDFAHPAHAVRALARCEHSSHVAAELLASTSAGLRRSVLARTGELVCFRPPEASWICGPDPERAAAALARWSARLQRWSTRANSGPMGDARAERDPKEGFETTLSHLAEALVRLGENLQAQGALIGEVERRLEAIEERLSGLEHKLCKGGPRRRRGERFASPS